MLMKIRYGKVIWVRKTVKANLSGSSVQRSLATAMTTSVATERYAVLLDDLVAAAAAPALLPGADRPAAQVMPPLVAKPWKRLRKQVRKAGDDPDEADLLATERKVYREDGSLASTSFYEPEKRRTETISYNPDGSVTNKTVRTAQQVEQYGPDGSLQKTATISVQHRLLDEVVLTNDGSRTRESSAPDQLDAHGNWTKLTRWQTDSQGTRPLTVAYRTLTYY